jgi:hypothetical protein
VGLHAPARLAEAAFRARRVARVLGLPQDKVHGIWVPGPDSYGPNDASRSWTRPRMAPGKRIR